MNSVKLGLYAIGIIVVASVSAEETLTYKSKLETSQNATVINIKWGTREEISKAWNKKRKGNVIGFAQYDIPGILCTINTIKPTDWNDEFAMATVGHEMMHCLGATHLEDDNGLGLKDAPIDDEFHEMLPHFKYILQ
jgi:hypothetical protein